MNTTDTAARPGLSALSWEDALRAAVAETQGATWLQITSGAIAWVLQHAKGFDLAVLWHDGRFDNHALPAYLTDPGAWGALMERELSGWRTSHERGVFFHVCQWDTRNGLAFKEGPRAPSLPLAVVFAVLAKHSHPDLPKLLAERPK